MEKLRITCYLLDKYLNGFLDHFRRIQSLRQAKCQNRLGHMNQHQHQKQEFTFSHAQNYTIYSTMQYKVL